MGSTTRAHRFQLPMFTRSTDVRDLHQCPAAWALKNFHEPEAADAVYFAIGTAIHDTIEAVVEHDLDLDSAKATVKLSLQRWEEGLSEERRVIESSKRSFDTMYEDVDRMMGKWFQDVHPDSTDRFPLYDQFKWPFAAETPFHRTARSARTQYGVWGSIDALFEPKHGETRLMVDWKSGATPKADSYQLHHYIFGAQLNPEKTTTVFHHIDGLKDHGKLQHADRYPGDNAIRRRILAAEATKEAGIFPAQPDWYCNYCTVQEWCFENPLDGESHDLNLQSFERMLQLSRPLSEPIQKEET